MTTPDNQKRLNNIAKLQEPAAREAFENSIKKFVNKVELATISALILTDVPAAVKLLTMKTDDFDDLAAAVQSSYTKGGQVAFNAIPNKQNTPNKTRFDRTFSGATLKDKRQIQSQMATLVKNISPSTRRAVRTTILNGIRELRSEQDIARDLVGVVNLKTGIREGGVLGHTAKDARTIQTMSRGLLNGDKKVIDRYFRLAGRDIKLDDKFKKEILANGRLSAESDRLMRQTLSNRYLFNRGVVNARTQTQIALTTGRTEAYNRQLEAGIVEEGSDYKVWVTFSDANVRASHVAANGQRVKYDQPFTLSGGVLMDVPRDSKYGAPAAEIINCRCFVEVEFKYIDFS